MRSILTAVVILLTATFAFAADKPNVVVIFADDLGYGDTSVYGATHVTTPNIDRLATQGRRFTDAHTASAVCTPSRYTLLTGRYPIRHGRLWGPVFLKSPLVVDTERVTIADIAKKAGYATACIGKWHLGLGDKAPTDWNAPLKPGPLELGFDHYFGMPTVNSHPPFVWVDGHSVVGLDPKDPFVYDRRAKTRLFDEKFGITQIGGADAAHAMYDDEKVGTTIANKAVDWIHAHKEEPFFLYLPTTNIHHPFTPAKQFQGTSKAGRYGDFIHELDWIVGEVLKALDDAGVADNTLVVFTSDNGGMFNRGGQEAWKLGHRLNGDLLGFKFDAWEGGHRVPFIARWPGRIEAGTVSDALVSNVDLMATLAAVSGQAIPDGAAEDSVDLTPALTGSPGTSVRDELLIAPAQPTHLAIRHGDWIYIGARGHGGFQDTRVGSHGFGGAAVFPFTGHRNSDVVDGRIRKDAPPAQLYNLREDPNQHVNVIREHPEIAERLAARLDEYRSLAKFPLPQRR